MSGKTGRNRDQCNPCFGGFQEFCFARLGQTTANTCLHDTGLRHVFRRELHAEHTVVAGVVIGARYHVEAGPHEIIRERRIRTHPGAAALCHGIGLVIVKQHLEIGKRHVNRAQQFDHLQVPRLFVHRQFARNDRIAGQRHREFCIRSMVLCEAECRHGKRAGSEHI